MLPIGTSSCLRSYGHSDFDPAIASVARPGHCPIVGCSSPLAEVPYSKSMLPYCGEHGIRLHAGTFVYCNGSTVEDKRKARLRNLLFAPDFAAQNVLDSKKKAETHRLGFEMSEDALSWNVFVGLLMRRKLRQATGMLIGKTLEEEPELFLWGSRVDLVSGASEPYLPLLETRKSLEPDIQRFPTEPDVMLIVPGKYVICVEAKFGSGNTLASGAPSKEGEKPKTIQGLIARYLGEIDSWRNERQSIIRERISNGLHSQLFRNIVFAARMAAIEGPRAEWRVVSLVSSTQWDNRLSSEDYSFADPTNGVRSILADGQKEWFGFRTWESLFAQVIQSEPDLESLRKYMLGKSAHYRPAFVLP